MNEQDKKAFEEWELDYFGTGKDDNCPHYMSHIKQAWQAACEYKEKELSWFVVESKSLAGVVSDLQEQNKKLRENLDFLNLIDYQATITEEHGTNFFSLGDVIHSSYLEHESIIKRARQVLKELEEK